MGGCVWESEKRFAVRYRQEWVDSYTHESKFCLIKILMSEEGVLSVGVRERGEEFGVGEGMAVLEVGTRGMYCVWCEWGGMAR